MHIDTSKSATGKGIIGLSAMHIAASENNVEIVEKLIVVFNGDKVALIEFVKDKDEDGRLTLIKVGEHKFEKNTNDEILIPPLLRSKESLPKKLFKNLFNNIEHNVIIYDLTEVAILAPTNVESLNMNEFEKLTKLFDGDNRNVLFELINDKNIDGSSVLNTVEKEDNIEIIEKLNAVFVVDIVYSYDISKYGQYNANSSNKLLKIKSVDICDHKWLEGVPMANRYVSNI
ncbi:hypothetical protein BLOT_010191 [Blomia tropicalis]|nr:hypothetical protein BLOT_010191 [Blomia tropicalis]